MAMAYNAGDKLKASARELLRNLDSWNKGQDSTALESALSKMFTSCTTGSDAALLTEEDAAQQQEQNTRTSNHPVSMRLSRNIKADYGEHIYEELFTTDNRNHRGQPLHGEQGAQPAASPRSRQASPRVFPASSPRSQNVVTPLGSDHLIVPHDRNFDDAISAVSAHTLEAMEQRINLNHSSDSSLFPSESNEKKSPKKMPRVSSRGSSKHSRSTHTTEDSSFEQRFADDERKFWKGEASMGRKHDLFFAHPHDTIPFSPEDLLPQVEEEEIVDLDDPFSRDPDRLAQVLVMPDATELGEI